MKNNEMLGPPVLAAEIFIVHSFHSDLKTYADAQEFCETKALNGFSSGRLFEPVTKSQNYQVYSKSIGQFGGLKNIWIGIKREPWRSQYTSSGGILEYKNWHPGQPENDLHDCVHLFNAHWYNYDCNYKTFFICQFDQRPSIRPFPDYINPRI